jgi:hypothetical protein
VKKGELYKLAPQAEKYPHIQDMFPYMKGGDVLIIGITNKTLRGNKTKKKYHVEMVDFLFKGIIYSESVDRFQKYAIYIGGS